MGQSAAAPRKDLAVKAADRFRSPLRYPGGKGRLAPFLGRLMQENRLADGHYAEAYAGGAGAAISLLLDEYCSHIHINDIDPSIHAFWHSVLHDTDQLCAQIERTPLSIKEWRRQRMVQDTPDDVDSLTLGFSTFYQNRTNRSGILRGGPIGGMDQAGRWGLDARFNRNDLIRRIRRIAAHRQRISLYRLDAVDFLAEMAATLPSKSLVYCDPPYFVKGQRRLYRNFYAPADHKEVAETLRSLPCPWVVSYDYVPEITKLYRGVQRIRYDINYSVEERYRGREVMFFSDELVAPSTCNPAYFRA